MVWIELRQLGPSCSTKLPLYELLRRSYVHPHQTKAASSCVPRSERGEGRKRSPEKTNLPNRFPSMPWLSGDQFWKRSGTFGLALTAERVQKLYRPRFCFPPISSHLKTPPASVSTSQPLAYIVATPRLATPNTRCIPRDHSGHTAILVAPSTNSVTKLPHCPNPRSGI